VFEYGNLSTGIPFVSVIGASRGLPAVDLSSALTPQGQAKVERRPMIMEQLVASSPFVRWSDYLTVPSVFEIPGMCAAFEAGRLGRHP